MTTNIGHIWNQLHRIPALEVAAYISLLLLLAAIAQSIGNNLIAHAASQYPVW